MESSAVPRKEASCKAEPAQTFIGRTATAAIGSELLAATGARQIRWARPRSALTMDFRPDRLTVSYDDSMSIIRIVCG